MLSRLVDLDHPFVVVGDRAVGADLLEGQARRPEHEAVARDLRFPLPVVEQDDRVHGHPDRHDPVGGRGGDGAVGGDRDIVNHLLVPDEGAPGEAGDQQGKRGGPEHDGELHLEKSPFGRFR